MSDLPKYFIGILIGVLIIGGVVMLFMQPSSDQLNTTDDSSISNGIQEKVDTISNNVNSTISNVTNGGSNFTNGSGAGSGALQSSGGSSVSGGQLEQNYQAGEGEIYQINYKDGNFRQYDTKTGELIGSTFDEDQEKLGVVNGEMQ